MNFAEKQKMQAEIADLKRELAAIKRILFCDPDKSTADVELQRAVSEAKQARHQRGSQGARNVVRLLEARLGLHS